MYLDFSGLIGFMGSLVSIISHKSLQLRIDLLLEFGEFVTHGFLLLGLLLVYVYQVGYAFGDFTEFLRVLIRHLVVFFHEVVE